jgi:tetratricopeptide (TPR) repeat protein
VKAFDAAIAANQVNADAWYKKGFALQQQGGGGKRGKLGGGGGVEGALAAYEKAVGIRERFPEVYRQVGLIYLDQDARSSKATEQFVKALQFYKDQKAPKAVFNGFIEEVRQRYVDAKLKGNAEAWVKEASQFAK